MTVVYITGVNIRLHRQIVAGKLRTVIKDLRASGSGGRCHGVAVEVRKGIKHAEIV